MRPHRSLVVLLGALLVAAAAAWLALVPAGQTPDAQGPRALEATIPPPPPGLAARPEKPLAEEADEAWIGSTPALPTTAIGIEPAIDVLDAVTRSPIAGARVIPGSRDLGGSDTLPHPRRLTGVALAYVTDESGHVDLPEISDTQEWWVVAPGHFGQRITVGPRIPAAVVALAPAGEARIRVAYECAAERALAKVRIERVSAGSAEAAGEPVYFVRDEATQDLLADGLEAGDWTVRIEVPGSPWFLPSEASRDFSVVAAETARVETTVPARRETARYDLDGVIEIGEGWKKEAVHVWVRTTVPVVPDTRFSVEVTQVGASSVTFRVARIPEGVYDLYLSPFHVRCIVCVPQCAVARIVVPPAVWLEVRVVDGETGKELDADVRLRGGPPDWLPATMRSSFTPEQRQALEGAGAWQGRRLSLSRDYAFDALPAGPYSLEVSAEGYRSHREDLALDAGRPFDEVTVRLKRP